LAIHVRRPVPVVRGARVVLHGHRVRQLSGDHRRGPGTVLAHGHQLFHHVVGVRRLPGRPGRDAGERDPRGARPLLDVRHKRVRRVAIVGRAIQHGVHTEPVRDLAGPVLGDHRPVHVPDENEPETRVPADRRRLGVQQRHQFPGHHLVETGPDRARAPAHVPVHQQHRLPDILVHHIVLRTAPGHGVYVLPDLHGGRHADQMSAVGHQSAIVHAVGRLRR